MSEKIEKIVCKICYNETGLKGNGTNYAGRVITFKTNDELVNHLEEYHDVVVKREGETSEQAKARVKAKNPRIGTPDCRCPGCQAKREGQKIINKAKVTDGEKVGNRNN